jgi:hypothetical protein
MAVKLHRCRFEWLKTGPCWRVEKALKEMGVDYELAPGHSRPSKRDEMMEHTGQRFYPAIEFAGRRSASAPTGASGALRLRLRERLVERGYLREEAFARVSE